MVSLKELPDFLLSNTEFQLYPEAVSVSLCVCVSVSLWVCVSVCVWRFGGAASFLYAKAIWEDPRFYCGTCKFNLVTLTVPFTPFLRGHKSYGTAFFVKIFCEHLVYNNSINNLHTIVFRPHNNNL